MKLTMNVSIKTSCFRSKTPTESSCRQSRPDRSSSASRGCVHVHVPAYRWVNFGSFAESVPRQVLILGLLVIPGAATGSQVLQFDKKSGAYHTSFNHQRSTKSPSQNAKMYVNQRRDEMARTWKHILRHDHFRAKYRYVGVFFERRFQPLSVGGFFSNQRESISRCPKSPFPSKTQNRQIARTSPLKHRESLQNDVALVGKVLLLRINLRKLEKKKRQRVPRKADLTEVKNRKLLFFTITHRTGCIHLNWGPDYCINEWTM